MKTKNFLAILLFYLSITLCFSQTNNCNINIKAEESTVIVNCGNGTQTYKGHKEIQKYFNKLIKDNQRLSQELGSTYANTITIKNKLSELVNISKQILTIQTLIPSLISTKIENEDIIKLNIEVLLFKEEFIGAKETLSNIKNTQSFSRLIDLTNKLVELDSQAIAFKNSGNYFSELMCLIEIKNLNGGDQIINERLGKTNESFLNFCQTEIIDPFDRVNKGNGIIPDENNVEYITIFDKFFKAYDVLTIELQAYEKWQQMLMTIITETCPPSTCNNIHSEVIYKITFMIYHNFARVKSKRKVACAELAKKLTSFIDVSIKLSLHSESEKKKALKKSIVSK